VADIHIDDFFKDAAGALTQLYLQFPRPVQLFVEDLTGPQEIDEFGLPNKRHMACFSTLLWLGEEEFIRYADTLRQEALDQATLTGRCFTALVSPASGTIVDQNAELPTYLQLEQGTQIHRIREALKNRSSVAIRAAILELLQILKS
jgi:hypothetical protein